MSTTKNADLEQRCSVLRTELKAWEKQFSAANDGRKAGREDIKANPAISAKYKEYNKTRDILARRTGPQTPSRPSRKRKVTEEPEERPKPQPATVIATPSKKTCTEHLGTTPESASKFLSPGPTFIGPTPQRDGYVLGLFDLLPAKNTPSKGNRKILGKVDVNVIQTPSKKNNQDEEKGSIETTKKWERTPQSSGKRFFLDQFVTPRKRKQGEEGTPTSNFKSLATSAFLRHDNGLGAIEEEEENLPKPKPFQRRMFGRTLSSMIRERKKQEDDRLDEEADIMREMEMEAEGMTVPKRADVPKILVEDSQAMPLGPDGAREPEDDIEGDDAENGLDQNGKPKKVWKKRGQKRQTRRVILRPNFHKPKPQADSLTAEHDDSDGQEQSDADSTPQNQDISDNNASDYSDDSHKSKKRKIRARKPDDKAANQESKKSKATESSGSVKTAARKVKESAHANYRRLKIKSKSAKGGKGRFGRGRR